MNKAQKRKWLIEYLASERGEEIALPKSEEDQISLLRGLLNVRPAEEPSKEFLQIQDEYLQERLEERGVVRLDEISLCPKGLSIWQGDITRLEVDAIVNAANSGLTGCWIPNHKCIDNCIHTYAGVQLRLACARIIEEQGYSEPFAQAKITDAFNLPCKKVIHTVGPIVSGQLREEHIELLGLCYENCLLAAEQNGLKSIAFCCISTGEFHFPNEEAAKIAISVCKDFIKNSEHVKQIIFNVFLDKDREIYEKLL